MLASADSVEIRIDVGLDKAPGGVNRQTGMKGGVILRDILHDGALFRNAVVCGSGRGAIEKAGPNLARIAFASVEHNGFGPKPGRPPVHEIALGTSNSRLIHTVTPHCSDHRALQLPGLEW